MRPAFPPNLIVSFVANLVGESTEQSDKVDDEAYDKGSLTGKRGSLPNLIVSLVEGSGERDDRVDDEVSLTGRAKRQSEGVKTK